MNTQYSSTVDHINSNTSAAESSSSGDTNKLKLFGFEFEFDPNPPAAPTQTHNHNHSLAAAEADESVDSSSNTAAGPNRTTPSRGKLRCEYCMKEFGNSQALGGHQNAHKKERMKKKRLQLQARRATTISSFYLHAPTTATRWFYDPAAACDDDDDVINYCHGNEEFVVYEESGRQISFNDVENNRQGGGGFTLTHHRPGVGGGRQAGVAGGSRGRGDLDLQLGLRLR